MDPNRLKAIPLFSQLSEQEAKRLAAFASETSVANGQILMQQGDYSNDLIAIEEGTARVEKDGREIGAVGAGDLIGEIGLLSNDPRSASVIATSPMLVFKLTHWEIRRMSNETVERIKAIVKQRAESGEGDPAHG
jgi:CRP-like cAMP-binding protein